MKFLNDAYETLAKLWFCLMHDFPARFALCEFDMRDIPDSLQVPHPMGITIRTGTKIGKDCTIHQNVTIGMRRGEDMTEAPATIGDNVVVCAGAVILGGITIGSGVTIGAGSVVLDDVPPAVSMYRQPRAGVCNNNHVS